MTTKEPKKEKYLFFYLKTGGGHLAPAKSVADCISKNYPDAAEPVLIDGFRETPRLISYLIEDGYRKLQARAKWFYELLYAVNKINAFANITAGIISFFCRSYIEKIIDNEKPDKLIILHFFLIKPVYSVIKKKKINIPVYTIITDPYTAHPMWFLEKSQNFIVFSRRLKEHITKKLPLSVINIFPFILDEKFSKPIPEQLIIKRKEDLGYTPEKKIILILGGGDGIPHGRSILKEIIEARLNSSIAIVCGKNHSLFTEAEKLKEHYKKNDLFIYGYVDFVYDLLNIADVVVTKCGASTMMEILMIKKIPVVNDYIWEQEKGNIEFLRDNNLGIYEPVIKNLPAVLKKLICDDNYYSFYRNNIVNARLENGTGKVARFLIGN